MNLAKSMRPVASFVFENTTPAPAKLCLIPGHYNTVSILGIVTGTETSTPYPITSFLSYADPSAIKAAGYDCDQVADDYNLTQNMKNGRQEKYPIEVISKSNKTRYRDFLNYIKVSGLKVTKMRITDLSTAANPSREIFNSEIEVAQSAIGSKSGSDFIQLSSHIDPSNYLQNFIEIDLELQNLLLDETTLAFLEVPGSARFQIDFTLAPTLQQ